ncbi:PDR/VanB family oxidoreductase [Microbacterium sp. G2-8]|uniref:PDR/VanB family oxidoreductase n=1 Tax=Microbacterium sp. G2-8 TaxID=2842454 RepID=UPI001C89C11B|nr:PDR/VanB family oxidoreductase [Microbacterium sp. G2-8]
MSFFSDIERELVVTARTPVAESVVALELRAPNGRPLPAWIPGAHIDLVLADGLVRQYSLCSSPDDRDAWRVAVLRDDDGRGGSVAAHDLRAGDRVRARGPRSGFGFETPRARERVCFIAGGIGITPILPMVRAAEAAGADWTLDYSVRTRAALPFADELAARGDRVRIHVSGEGGRADLSQIVVDAGDAPVWACGPERMLGALREATGPDARLHVEPFTTGNLPSAVRREPFDVEVMSSGQVLTVPADRSVLDVLEDNDVFVLSSCREGTCGTCETVVVDGEVDHRDRVLSEAERASSPVMMVCVSRAACPRIVLDL